MPGRNSPAHHEASNGPQVRIPSFIRSAARFAFRYEPLRGWRIRMSGEGRRLHPVDREYGIRTGGSIASEVLYRSQRAAAGRTFYVGSQAGVVRRALALVRDPQTTVLLDLGCGKGRVLAIGSEFPFREIVGVELAETLAVIAEQNMAIVRRSFPERSPIRVVNGDAGAFPLPDAALAIFLFHPFGEATMRRLAARIDEAIATRAHAVTVIYYNPVYGAVFDSMPGLVRAHALEVPYDEFERGVDADESSAVVVWEDRRSAGAPSAGASREILVIDAMHTHLAPAVA
jgi:SAM-dependent methyltransferase